MKNNHLQYKYLPPLLIIIMSYLFILHTPKATPASKNIASTIPVSLKKQLASLYPGYYIPPKSEFSSSVTDALDNASNQLQPAVIKGDWNGDGKTDIALLLIKRAKEEHLIVVSCHNISQKRYHIIELDHILRQKVLGVTKLLDFLRVANPQKQKSHDLDTVSPSSPANWKYTAIERTVIGQGSTVYYWDGTHYRQLHVED